MSTTLRVCIAIAGVAFLLAVAIRTDSAVISLEPTATEAIIAAATDTNTPTDASSTCGGSGAMASAAAPAVPSARERTTLTGSGALCPPAEIDEVQGAD
ncbi:hypothetical protein [Paraburkholderia sp. BR10954]|uniref:hypothetical protein n=1 Tax=Paraburkholderia sp. BR10954 TaxID=3236995 RepID=UPI0034D16F2B